MSLVRTRHGYKDSVGEGIGIIAVSIPWTENCATCNNTTSITLTTRLALLARTRIGFGFWSFPCSHCRCIRCPSATDTMRSPNEERRYDSDRHGEWIHSCNPHLSRYGFSSVVSVRFLIIAIAAAADDTDVFAFSLPEGNEGDWSPESRWWIWWGLISIGSTSRGNHTKELTFITSFTLKRWYYSIIHCQ
jgi:hypothetical protein